MKDPRDIPGPLAVLPDELVITRRQFPPVIAGEHALDAYAHGLDVVDGRPAVAGEQVEADDAVGVDVWVDGDGDSAGAGACAGAVGVYGR